MLPAVKRIAVHAMAASTMPFVTLTFAQTLDGGLALPRGGSFPISSEQTLHMTHALRAAHDGILIGVGTLKADNPSLTVRHVPGRSPKPIVLDSKLETPLTCRLLTLASCRKPLIITCTSRDAGTTAYRERWDALVRAGATIVAAGANENGTGVAIAAALQRVFEFGIRSVMVEGGARIIAAFLATAGAAATTAGRRSIVGQLIITVAPMLLPSGLRVPQTRWPHDESVRLDDVVTTVVGCDIVIAGILPPPRPTAMPVT